MKPKYIYARNTNNKLIYRFRTDVDVPSDFMFSSDGMWNMSGLTLEWMKQRGHYAPISTLAVKFFERDGGYNTKGWEA